ncbi:conserved protein, unknown function [Hepatocystis sp. ex Piliocolobus tephrosceles]|nr:conserved protein, unknown function [Hepatocystis sp. ex Piliocolobus tephrosceles]
MTHDKYCNDTLEHLYEKCLNVPNTICVGGTTQVIGSNNIHKGLIGKWKFDDIYAIDYSANKNNMHKIIRPSPGFNGHGYSGAFIGDIYGFVAANDSLKTAQFTIAFWIYLLERSTHNFRNIFSQTDGESDNIAILLYPYTTKLSVRIIGQSNSNEGLSSIGYIPIRRWTHIVVTLSDKNISIYMNGILDNLVALKFNINEKKGNLTIGKSNKYSSFNGYLDELYFYNRNLNMSEIKSFVVPNITGINDTEFVYIGNYNCDYKIAKSVNLCRINFHLCSSIDLYNGAIHYARINGIIEEKSNIWTSDISENSFEEGEKRIALCCKTYD